MSSMNPFVSTAKRHSGIRDIKQGMQHLWLDKPLYGNQSLLQLSHTVDFALLVQVSVHPGPEILNGEVWECDGHFENELPGLMHHATYMPYILGHLQDWPSSLHRSMCCLQAAKHSGCTLQHVDFAITILPA